LLEDAMQQQGFKVYLQLFLQAPHLQQQNADNNNKKLEELAVYQQQRFLDYKEGKKDIPSSQFQMLMLIEVPNCKQSPQELKSVDCWRMPKMPS